MNEEKIEIKEIQKKLEQLSQKQLELEKTHQQQFFLYRWLQGPDPELQSVKEEITRLDRREQEYLKILQAAASAPPPAPEVDWSQTPLYWKRLTKFGLITPADQLNAYTSQKRVTTKEAFYCFLVTNPLLHNKFVQKFNNVS